MRLEETLQRKEQLVREVNKKKSRDANTQYCQKLLTELNENNCVQLIDEYCKSELDDQKAEVLLEQFEPIFEARSKLVKTDKNASQNLSKDLLNLEKELESLNNRIRV
jgi:glutamate synthase domain-containing protein 3